MDVSTFGTRWIVVVQTSLVHWDGYKYEMARPMMVLPNLVFQQLNGMFNSSRKQFMATSNIKKQHTTGQWFKYLLLTLPKIHRDPFPTLNMTFFMKRLSYLCLVFHKMDSDIQCSIKWTMTYSVP